MVGQPDTPCQEGRAVSVLAIAAADTGGWRDAASAGSASPYTAELVSGLGSSLLSCLAVWPQHRAAITASCNSFPACPVAWTEEYWVNWRWEDKEGREEQREGGRRPFLPLHQIPDENPIQTEPGFF